MYVARLLRCVAFVAFVGSVPIPTREIIVSPGLTQNPGY